MKQKVTWAGVGELRRDSFGVTLAPFRILEDNILQVMLHIGEFPHHLVYATICDKAGFEKIRKHLVFPGRGEDFPWR